MAANQEERIISAVSANPPSTTEQNGSSEQSNPPAPQKAESAPQAEVSLTLKMSKTSVCEGEQVSFTPGASTGGMRYSWTFGDGEQSTKSAPVKAFDNAGTYEVKLTATKEGRSWERTETIEVMPAPDARITGAENMKGALPLFTLKTELQAGESCTWTFGDGRKATESEVRHLFRKRDAAAVTLTVTNGQGCSATEKLKIPMVKDFNLFAQTAFTPNGDVNNEVFVPKALEAMECDFEMIIRDAKGTIVFRTSSVNQPWDGRDLGGVLQPKGLYFWTVVLKEAIAPTAYLLVTLLYCHDCECLF
jgi:PKD repeat protein